VHQFDSGGDYERYPRLDDETPLRRRARLRAERERAGRRTAISSFLWLAAGALFIPMLLVFGGFFVRRALGQTQEQSLPIFQIVTSTPPPIAVGSVGPEGFIVPTQQPPSTFAPGIFSTWLYQPNPQPFASATPGSLLKSYIVYVCYVKNSDEICLMNADGTAIRQLTRESKYTDWYPSFSPDGEHILFSSQRSGHFDLFIMDIHGENIRQITRDMGDCYAPSLSPDGMRVVFASTQSGSQNIWQINLDGTGLKQLTTNARDNVDPVWSPDSSQISFTSTQRGSGDLMIMNADGSNIRRVTKGINVEGRNSWSPDGKYLSFYAGPIGDKDIYVVNSDCADAPEGCGPGQMRQLTDGGNNKAPDFSPDGQWITFASELDGRNEVFIIRVDASELRQLTYSATVDWQPRWGPWHP